MSIASDSEELFEDLGYEPDEDERPGPLVSEIVRKVGQMADLDELERYDSKFDRFRDIIKSFITEHPSEKAFVDAWDGMLSIGAISLSSDRRGALSSMAHVIDGVVGGTRFESCVSMTPSLAERW